MILKLQRYLILHRIVRWKFIQPYSESPVRKPNCFYNPVGLILILK